MAFHPVDIAFQRVDLAIMRQHPERLRQPPLRKGVGRIALMIDRKRAFKPVIHQVRVERRHLFGQHHPLVDDRPARQRTQVNPLNLRRQRRLFDPPPDDVQLALKLLRVRPGLAPDQNLLNLGPRRIGLVAQHRHIHRHMPPAIDVMPHPQDFGLDNGPAAFLRPEIRPRQKHLPHRDQLFGVRLVPGPPHLVIEKLDRDLQMNPRPVPGLAVRIHRPAVPHRLERHDAVFHHPPRRFPRNRHHQTDSAR